MNEWMTKTGHHIPYLTQPCPEGFSSCLVLPLEGAGEAGTAVGVAKNKKEAEAQCASNALQILGGFGLLDVLHAPPKAKRMGLKARPGQPRPFVGAMPTEAPGPGGAAGAEDFAAVKGFLLQQVMATPGKRTTCYMMMCPAGEKRKRVTAALYQLAEEGQLVKHEPTAGKNMVPFWAPVGYDGPLGGGVTEADLGEGRSLPLTEVKMVCYDILAKTPCLTAWEIANQAKALGHAWEVKVINAALYAMEKESTAEAVLETLPHGINKRWNAK